MAHRNALTAAFKVVWAQVCVRQSGILEQEVDDGRDGVTDSDRCFLGPFASCQAAILGAKVGPFRVTCGMAGLGQDGSEPLVPFPSLAATALPGALIVPGTLSNPGGKVA